MPDAQPSKRTLILERALTLFADRGYNGVGVEEIAAAAGVTKPTLYHYFGSKQGVLETLIAEQYDPYLDELRIAARYDGDLQRSLSQIIHTIFDFGSAHPRLYWMVLAAGLTANNDIATQVMSSRITTERAILIALFDDATHDLGAIRGKQRLSAETLLAMIAIHLRLASRNEITLDDQAVLFLIRHLIYGISS